MTHVITSLCIRDGGCVAVCPVECIIPGNPQDEWPWFYIDPETCIDCGACIPECPYGAIFPAAELPNAYTANGNEHLAMPVGTPGYTEVFEGEDIDGNPIKIKSTRVPAAGEEIDLTPAKKINADFFKSGPGYEALTD